MKRFLSQLNFFDEPIAPVLLARRKGSGEGKRSLFSSAEAFSWSTRPSAGAKQMAQKQLFYQKRKTAEHGTAFSNW